ncbi:MAG: Uma2 family endonuclease [Thermoguttaceae bacterium]|jgi:Uma2 family endonuclease
MATIETITTAEQLLAAGDVGRCELVRGELIIMSPAGAEHGWIITNIAVPLGRFVEQRSLGVVFGAGTGFRIGHSPDTVRAPDVAFVTAGRIGGKLARGFFPGAPDLAVEVLSPDDRAGEVLAKVQDWLDAGCLAVWVADPRTRTVTVYHSRSDIVVLGESENISGGDLLPDFSLPVGELFQG